MSDTANNGTCGAVVLAAGGSTRLGRPKQLEVFNGEPLVVRAAGAALAAGLSPVVVVLGAQADRVRPLLDHLPVFCIQNVNWKKGMGNSIACGIQALLSKEAPVERMVLMLCDQPFVDAALLQEFVRVNESAKKGIVISDYGTAKGPPVLFEAKYFESLSRLVGDEGARSVIRRNRDDLAFVAFLKGSLDIDTDEDVRRMGSG